MLNFNYCNPTRILFGRDEHKKIGEALKKEGVGKVLIVYGGGSALKNGTISAVQTSLEEVGIEYFTIGGVRANPTLEFAGKVTKIAVESQVDALLAVGGGSVIDTCKVAAAWAKYEGDAWDFFTKGVAIKDAIPVACVLTIPAAGSEQSIRMVINHNDLKLGTASEKIRPMISVVNPELFFTLPENQIAAGVVDMISHIFERYFTNTENVEFEAVRPKPPFAPRLKWARSFSKIPKTMMLGVRSPWWVAGRTTATTVWAKWKTGRVTRWSMSSPPLIRRLRTGRAWRSLRLLGCAMSPR